MADNIVPGECTFMIDRRMIPGESRDAVVQEIEEVLAVARKLYNVDGRIKEFRPTTGPATETALDQPIVQAATRCAAPHNENHAVLGFPAGCDLVHFRSIGAQGVILGPGDLGVAHKPNEYIEVDELIRAPIIYRDIVLQMLPSH